MKKLLMMIMIATMTLTLFGCSSEPKDNDTDVVANEEQDTNVDTEDEVEEETDVDTEDEVEEETDVDTEDEVEEETDVDTEGEVEEETDVDTEDEVEEETDVDTEVDTDDTATSDELNLEEIITQAYEVFGEQLPMTVFTELTKENQAYMLGTDTFDFVSGVVSEPMMTSVAHSFVLFTVEDGADIDSIKEAVRNNVDVRKWICVSVEPEQVVVENFGNVIVLIMDERSEAMFEALESVMESM